MRLYNILLAICNRLAGLTDVAHINYFSVNSTTMTFNIPNGYRGIILVQAPTATASRHGIYSVVITTTGSVLCPALIESNYISSMVAGTNSISITTSGNAYISFIGRYNVTRV